MKSTLYLFALTALLFAGCQQKDTKQVTDPADYNAYLEEAPSGKASKYFQLWNSKIKPDSMQLTSFSVVAGEYAKVFEQTGEIAYLKKAEQSLRRGLQIAAIGKADFYRSLARNYVSQHRFNEAAALADSAMAMGSGQRATHALQFDVLMELGRYTEAKAQLDALKDMGRLDYLIRLSKWNDHSGDLDAAIFALELASERAERSGNPSLINWCYTNLADYYGHAGEIAKSYEFYLKALEGDPSNAYAKKGIAWIVYSYERRPKEAMRILDAIGTYYQTPDLWKLQAEIAGDLGDSQLQARYLDRYFQTVDNKHYGVMYNTHSIELCLEQTGQDRMALELAQAEIHNRETPETASLLAYAYLQNGDLKRALQWVESAVDGHTYEPVPLLYAAEVYKAAGRDAQARDLARELEEAVYELGPGAESRLEKLKS